MGYKDQVYQEQIKRLAGLVAAEGRIDPTLYTTYEVKRGLRDINGRGVLVGLTEIADVHAYDMVDGQQVPCEGRLYYRGYNIEQLVDSFWSEERFGFEETTYLLLFGTLPTAVQLAEFRALLASRRTLPRGFTRDVLLKAPSGTIMNALMRGVLTLFAYDANAEDIDTENVLRQSIDLIAQLPLLSVYAYHSFSHYLDDKSLHIHHPLECHSIAENILHMLRPDCSFSQLEARVLDLCLVLHAEHGGGNNSSFTTHVVTSSGTDTYSAMAAALASLKGPRHGGANIKVCQMMEDLKANLYDWADEDAITAYLEALLDKQAFDRQGLIYGMGHAVYSLSDPRANMMRTHVQRLAAEKGRTDEYSLYERIERLAPEVIGRKRNIYKGVAANVDFFSGFVYSMLDIPLELYTPLFAIARIAGWSAHRMEELVNAGKIIRPAYRCVLPRREFVPLGER